MAVRGKLRQYRRLKKSRCPPCYGWMFATAVLLTLTHTVAWAQTGAPPYWYDPPCRHHDFAWTTRSNEIQQCQFLEIDEDNPNSNLKNCQNPLAQLTNESMRPPAAENVWVTYYTTEFKYSNSDLAGWGGVYSAVNITFSLGLEAAGKISGVLFSIESLSLDSDDYRTKTCRAYDFGEPLQMDALLDRDNNPVELYFDYFRGQTPGMEYEYTVRTLPVFTTNGEDPNDTVFTLRYRSPSCYSIFGDYFCKTPTGGQLQEHELCAHWKPQYFLVTATFRDLSVAVELGPDECSFTKFQLAVRPESSAQSGDGDGALDIDVASMDRFETFEYGRNITYIKIPVTDVPEGRQVVVVTPTPNPHTCFNGEGGDRACAVVYSAVIAVTENPCLTSPCNSIEVCAVIKNGVTCECREGFTRNDVNYRCEVASPCESNPCGNGTCHHKRSHHRREYSCQCAAGFMERNKTCQADPCQVRYQDRDSNPCGYHGKCRHTDQSYGTNGVVVVDFQCYCNLGYHYNDEEKSCQVSTVILIMAIIASFLVALLLLGLLLAWKRCQRHGGFLNRLMRRSSDNEEIVSRDRPSPTNSEDGLAICQDDCKLASLEIIPPPKRIRVVIFSTRDHPNHNDVVEKLALFLSSQCMCDVQLPIWCAQDIARKGVSEWITHILQWADKVILLCSQGTQLIWQSYCNDTHSDNWDIFTQAVSAILNDSSSSSSVGLPSKHCVAYPDYSLREYVPSPLSTGAIYCLMKHADSLFFRLHDLTPHSPRSHKRVRDLEEGNYATASPQGAALHSAMQKMHAFLENDPGWFGKFNSELLQSATSVLICDEQGKDDEEWAMLESDNMMTSSKV